MNWETYWANILRDVAAGSKDRSRKYGALIVDVRQRLRSTGYNGIPRGIEYKEVYHDRPDKYMYFIHAELNAILNAAAVGTPTEGCAMYLVNPPCASCAGAIINSGIVLINYLEELEIPEVHNKDEWIATMDASREILQEAGIKMRLING
jgi:dCMP deaminase